MMKSKRQSRKAKENGNEFPSSLNNFSPMSPLLICFGIMVGGGGDLGGLASSIDSRSLN